MRNILHTVRDREFLSTGHHYKVTYGLSKIVKIFDLWWPWKVKVSNRNLRCGIFRKRYEIEFVSTEHHCISPYSLSKNFEIFNLWLLWKVKVTNRNLRCGIFRKRYEIESSYPQETIIKLDLVFSSNVKYLTFGDPERSRSLTEILDAEYLANGTR